MQSKFINKAISKLSDFPLRINLLYLLVIAIVTNYFINQNFLGKNLNNGSNLKYQIATLSIQIISFLFITISLLSIIFTIINYFNCRKKEKNQQVDFEKNEKKIIIQHNKKVALILTHTKIQIITTDKQLVGEKFIEKKLFSSQQIAIPLELPHIQYYHIEALKYYFTDIFGFIKLKVNKEYQIKIPNFPTLIPIKNFIKIKNENYSDIESRTYSKIRKEGDLLDLKSFENGDDYRRINWKIYAKSNQLIIQKPELITLLPKDIFIGLNFDAGQFKQNTLDQLDAFKEVSFSVIHQFTKSNPTYHCYLYLQNKFYRIEDNVHLKIMITKFDFQTDNFTKESKQNCVLIKNQKTAQKGSEIIIS